MSAALSLVEDAEPIPARALLRISEDPFDLKNGVDRQRSLVHEAAPLYGCRVERIHEDNDRSGWKPGVWREEFHGVLLPDIKAGRVRAVIAFDQDRITRQTEEWAMFRRLCRAHGVRVFTVTEGDLRIDTTSGGLSTGLKALLAEQESEMKSVRIKAAVKERVVKSGKTTGGVLYGWRRVVEFDARGNRVAWHDEPHPEQAEIVREVVARVAAGETSHAICADLNGRGVPTAKAATRDGRVSGKWELSTIRSLVLRPANVGRVVHHGAVVPGLVADAPALVEVGLWETACAVLRDPQRRSATDNRIRRLLSGLALCDACGGPLRYKTQRRKSTGAVKEEVYLCTSSGHVSISAELADQAVTDLVVAKLTELRVRDLLPEADDEAAKAQDEVDRLKRELADLEAQAGDLPASVLVRLLSTVSGKLAAAEERVRGTVVGPGAMAAVRVRNAADPEQAWDALPLATKRLVLKEVFVIRLRRARTGEGNGTRAADFSGRRHDPSRLAVEYRQR